MAAKLTLTKGEHSLVLDFKGNGRIDEFERNTPLAAPGYNRVTLMSLYHEDASDDFDYTYTPPAE